MGLVERLGRMQILSKKECKRLYWRMTAALKKATRNGSKPRVKFQYDPYSYALNFDDGFRREMEEKVKSLSASKI